MASLQGNTVKDTYKSLLKVADNGELEATAQEITDGNGNGTGVSLNTSGDVTATGTVAFGSLKDSGENITVTKFVDEADGIAANDNDTSIPTSAAVKDYVDSNVTAQDLDITDGTNNGSVDLDSQSLTFTGDAGVSATVSGQTLTLDSSALQSQIDSNDSDITALQAADTTLQSNIDAEETARIAADTDLANDISTEASTRASADTTLQGNIDAEASTRAAADTSLQNQITANDGDISGLDTRLTTAEGNITSNDGDISALDGRLTTAEAGIFVNDQDITNLNTRLTTAEGNITSNDTDISALQSGKQDISEKNQANGYAPLDGGAKIPIANLPDSVVGQVEYQGTWNASTDTPTLPSASTVKGHYYVVSAGGTYETITYAIGDWVISNGTAWEKVDNTDAVTTVFGRLGAIVANESDYSAYYPLISDLNTTNSNVSALDTRLTTAEGDITAIETKTDNITVTQPVNLDTIESDLATAKSDITAIETKTDNITVTQAVNLDTMESDIATNASNIASNDTDISNLQSDKYDKTGGTITGNVTVTGDLSATNIAGTLSTAAQTNITSVGTLSSLAVSGNLAVDTNTLFVDAANNNVGIGTSSPLTGGGNASWLTLEGSTYSGGVIMSVSDVAKGYLYYDDTGEVTLQGGTGVDVKVVAGGSERMRIDSSGRVGIGTSSPVGNLFVKSTASTSFSTQVGVSIGGASSTGAVEIYGQAGTGAALLDFSPSDGVTDFSGRIFYGLSTNHMAFFTNGGERMRIDSSGNVGIGTSSPTQLLHLRSAAPAIEFDDSGFATVKGRISSNEGNLTLEADYNNSRASSIIGFNVDGAERMRIDASGNIGIGTSSPAVKLDVEGSGTGDTNVLSLSNFETDDSGDETVNIKFRLTRSYSTPEVLNDAAFIKVGKETSWTDTAQRKSFMSFWTRNGATEPTEKMRITGGGDVLVGTTGTPSTSNSGVKLSNPVVGACLFSAGSVTSTVNQIAFINGNGTVGRIQTDGSSTSYITSSDYRLKENVVEMTGALDRVDALKPSRFNFIADSDKIVDGFLAHEVAEVVPEAISGEKDEVDEEGNPVYQGIDQSKLVPLLVGAIQELKAEIETLKSQING